MCRGEDDLLFSVGVHQKHDPVVTPKVGTVNHRCEHADIGLVWQAAHLIEPFSKLSGIVPVNFAVVLLWGPRPFFGGPV